MDEQEEEERKIVASIKSPVKNKIDTKVAAKNSPSGNEVDLDADSNVSGKNPIEENKFDSKDIDDPPIAIVTFLSSQYVVDSHLTAYLTEVLQDPYNKWCLDCKMNLSTHAIVFFGTFVCENCAGNIVNLFDRETTWPKKVLGEHWDDYQLMHIAKGCGGNRPLYLLF